jgi:biopolymer transport protein ExbD
MKVKRRPDLNMPDPLISLIDVVFFLLVFFMLVGRMDATAPFDVVPPMSLAGENLPRGGVTLSLAADGRLALDGQEMDEPAALTRLNARMGAGGPLVLRINAAADLPLNVLLPLVARLEASGAQNVVLIVTPNPT